MKRPFQITFTYPENCDVDIRNELFKIDQQYGINQSRFCRQAVIEKINSLKDADDCLINLLYEEYQRLYKRPFNG